MLIVCDFDGTVTDQDITVLIWDRHYQGDWRREILPGYEQGTTHILELMAAGYRKVRLAPAELLEQVRGKIGLRQGFTGFARTAREAGSRIHVLSCGLDFYIREYLPAGIPFDSYIGDFETGWQVRQPHAAGLGPKDDFKVHVLSRLLAESGGAGSVYVGDGRNDFAAARMSDRIFAVEGSDLARLCRAAGVPFEAFTSFDQVRDALFPRAHEPVR